MSIYDRYAPFIREYIYSRSWQSLRAVQTAAGDVLFNTDDNLLLCASTASGKTEAVFFPILTDLWENPPSSVGAIYIGPLKALINDQFLRLEELCRDAGIPVWHRHGDVSQSHREKMFRNPSGVLQITPESLEALLMRRNTDIPRLFGDLRYIVVDEVHSLMRGDRGGQTICLIERLCAKAGVSPRRIGLSATLGDPESAGEFLSGGSGRRTAVPGIAEKELVWRLAMEHFFTEGEQAGDGTSVFPDVKTDSAPEGCDPGLSCIFEHTRGKKCLVFVNSREECEEVTASLRRMCELRHEPDRFMIHHGNLSASFRETAEDSMKDENRALTTVTTATLELGIDIGRLERAFQIDAPYTVSSFLQRMGRTGRRGNKPEMWFIMREERAEPRAMLPATVPWPLIQGISLIQLYADDRWVEPQRMGRLPFSLLYHQTMSALASGGETSPAALASKVLPLTPFRNITREDYRVLLRHLISTGHIERTERGGLIVGTAGERVINSYKFYAVFRENEEYTVRSRSQELGTIVRPPPVGEKIAIAGKVWTVEELDRKRRLVFCDEVKGQVPAYFGECAGDIHTAVLEKMRSVLSGSTEYPYLLENAKARLAEARRSASMSGMTEKPLINLGGDMWCLFPWLGSYSFLALERLIRLHCADEIGLSSFSSKRPFFMQFRMKVNESDFFKSVKAHAEKDIDPISLLWPGECPVFDKYDEYLPEELVRKGFAFGVLDIKGMKERTAQW